VIIAVMVVLYSLDPVKFSSPGAGRSRVGYDGGVTIPISSLSLWASPWYRLHLSYLQAKYPMLSLDNNAPRDRGAGKGAPFPHGSDNPEEEGQTEGMKKQILRGSLVRAPGWWGFSGDLPGRFPVGIALFTPYMHGRTKQWPTAIGLGSSMAVLSTSCSHYLVS